MKSCGRYRQFSYIFFDDDTFRGGAPRVRDTGASLFVTRRRRQEIEEEDLDEISQEELELIALAILLVE